MNVVNIEDYFKEEPTMYPNLEEMALNCMTSHCVGKRVINMDLEHLKALYEDATIALERHSIDMELIARKIMHLQSLMD